MKITVTGNGTCGINYQQLSKKHLGHDLDRNHDNKYLLTQQSKHDRRFNREGILLDYEKINHARFDDQLEKHDERMRKSGHPERCWNDLNKYQLFTSKGKRRTTMESHRDLNTGKLLRNKVEAYPYESYVQRLGRKEIWDKWKQDSIKKIAQNRNISRDQAHDLVLKVVADGLETHAKGFNDRHQLLKMCRYDVHMDEKGVPHYHHMFIGLAKTPSGKNSWNIPLALGQEAEMDGEKVASINKKGYKSYDQRIVWRHFHDVEDNSLITCLNKQIDKELGDCHLDKFELMREKDNNPNLVTNLSHEDYIRKEQTLSQIQKEIEQEKINKKIKEMDANIAEADLLVTQNKLDKAKDKLKQVETDYNSWVDSANKKLLKELQNKLQQVNKKEQEQNRKREEQERITKEQTNREKQLDKKEIDLNAQLLGGIDSNGRKYQGIVKRRFELDDKEEALNKREKILKRNKQGLLNQQKEIAKQQGLIKMAVQSFADGYMQAMTGNPNDKMDNLEDLPDWISISTTRPKLMIKGFTRGIQRAIQVVAKNNLVKRLAASFKHADKTFNRYQQENIPVQEKNPSEPQKRASKGNNRDITDDLL